MTRILIIGLMMSAISCGQRSGNTAVADTKATMYHNGDIVTMEGDSAVYVEAVVVKDGKIIYAGPKDEAMKQAGEGHDMVDLQGKFMAPGFIDGHGHAFGAGFQKLAANILPPPDGPVTDI